MTDRLGLAVGEVGATRRRCDAASADASAREAELLDQVRGGSLDAYAEIYALHRASVERLARRLCREPHEADDVVSEVFCNALQAIRNGRGPRSEARAYLLRSVRHTVVKLRTRKDTGRATVCEPDHLDRVVHDDVERGGPATDALETVSPRLREVLWHVEVDGFDTRQVAASEAIAPPAAASLVYRARRSLRRAYLGGCMRTPTISAACEPIRSLIPGFVDGDTNTPGADRVRAHLATCDACHRALDEVIAVHDRFAASTWLLLVPAMIRSLISGTTHSVATAGTTSLLVLATVGTASVTMPSDAGAERAIAPSAHAVGAAAAAEAAHGAPVAVFVAPEPADTGVDPTPRSGPAVHDAAPTIPDLVSPSAAPATDEPVASVAVPQGPGTAEPTIEHPGVVDPDTGDDIVEVVGFVDQTAGAVGAVVGGIVDGTVGETVDLVAGVGDAVTGDAGVVDAVAGDVTIVDRTTDVVDDVIDTVVDGVDEVDDLTAPLLDGLGRSLLGPAQR